ncbi:2-oxoglutarate (2OG) and Fe(II)-dependent oxygenase superfamily protein [Rhynchospora pubera]|uniref:2-oxoglutarate (2OG) and Fe(II)-dependent oxygenase superfamily protein n=1 Tax=Rhynchospora pubera TaxID=906938 RepID=A0AAV8DAP8_9POAL|nr:2-oxoglutarate (2OG) and Fe(II)-dependent oxygenase superfamily protein [Rhynchospora pubera]
MDCLQDWPEPIVRVQSLSESGASTIPARYIKPPNDRPSPTAISNCHVSIPVIDMSADPEHVARVVSSACREWGFFQVVNHGVDPKLMRCARDTWCGFFHEPMEIKQQYANSPKTYEGYGSRLGTKKGALLDWGDYYFLHVHPPSLINQEKWPALPSSLRPTTDEYTQELLKLCRRLMRVLSKGLGLKEGCLQEAFGGDKDGACLRVNFYPKCPQPDLTLGLSPHSDPGGMTVLQVDDHVKGLQVCKDGAWVTVQPVPDSFIINIADQIEICLLNMSHVIHLDQDKVTDFHIYSKQEQILRDCLNHPRFSSYAMFCFLLTSKFQVLSNGAYKSVEHRVMVSSTAERLSMAFFYNPCSDIPLAPIPQLVMPDRPPLFQPMTFNEYRLYIRKNGPKGKSQVESLKIVPKAVHV